MLHLTPLLSTVAVISLAVQSACSPVLAAAPQRVEVAFVLDTTGSMGELIDGAKRKIWSIANTIVDSNPDADIAMALVAYRDRGDRYVVETVAMSEDIQALYGKLTQLEADGGNDTPESVNAALNEAVSGLQWSSGAHVKRIVFLVGDAPPHMDYAQERQYPAILKDAARRDIIVNAVQAGSDPETTTVWKEIAQFGGGRFMAIPQDGGEVSIIITPYDEDILHLQKALDDTVVPYGSREKREAFAGKMREKAAAPKSVQVENSEYYAKRASKKEVVTGGGDLIADLRNKQASLSDLKTEDLPEEIRSLGAREQQDWYEQKLAARLQLEDKIAALVKKRDAHILVERQLASTKRPADSFDEVVAETLKTQLE